MGGISITHRALGLREPMIADRAIELKDLPERTHFARLTLHSSIGFVTSGCGLTTRKCVGFRCRWQRYKRGQSHNARPA
jgi:hypothetical protein